MSDDNVKEKVREMAKLAMLTNRISEVHEKNLKMYPFVFFEGVASAEIKYDLSNNMDADTTEDKKNADIGYSVNPSETKNLRVSYRLTLDETKNNSLDKRFKAIEDSIRNLFWKQVSVEVYFNDKKVYESTNV